MSEARDALVEEVNALSDRRQALRECLSNDIVWQGMQAAEVNRLRLQLQAMDMYSEVLTQRIAAFADDHEAARDATC